MKYGLVVLKETTNLGDDIQSYSIKNLLPKIDYYIEREKLDEFTTEDNKPVKVIIDDCRDDNEHLLSPSPFIDPLFIEQTILTLEKFKDVKKSKDVCLVDLDYFNIANVKSKFKNVITISHQIDEEYASMTYDERFAYVEKVLRIYQSSKTVITTRLHCALSCLTLGTPVILVYDGDVKNRLSGYEKMLNLVPREEFQKNYEKIIRNVKRNPNDFEKYRKNIIEKITDFF